MMMMMGLGRPKIRNDGSFSPGPRSSSRSHTTTPCSSSSFCFHLLSSFSYQGIIITTLLHPADAHPSVPPSESPKQKAYGRLVLAEMVSREAERNGRKGKGDNDAASQPGLSWLYRWEQFP
ncbi:hypothetical protein BRADI_5g09253v3 [Brachypodium distachyon]|uniref:Uncharacterized protein n=1 Tax=Brachypodium distachyon TaxID=15368 RepID=A0A0Q3I8R2_BRADI|nr:hypothetical protein BRADI_5g09253v3 [Brachypodium distachyon]